MYTSYVYAGPYDMRLGQKAFSFFRIWNVSPQKGRRHQQTGKEREKESHSERKNATLSIQLILFNEIPTEKDEF